jgi:hypothetical protein
MIQNRLPPFNSQKSYRCPRCSNETTTFPINLKRILFVNFFSRKQVVQQHLIRLTRVQKAPTRLSKVVSHIPILEIDSGSMSSPLVREWTALLIHAGIAFYQTADNPSFVQPSQVHAAATVAILTSLMAPECHEFNLTLVHIALKAAVVRLALVYLVGRSIFLSSTILPPNDRPLDWFVRKDAAAFMAQPVLAPPRLRQLLVALSGDPSPQIRAIAENVLRDPAHHKLDNHPPRFSRDAPPPSLSRRATMQTALRSRAPNASK